MQKIYLGPAEWNLSECATRVETVLGSCVALTMHSPHHRLGAVCHCILPAASEADLADMQNPGRFVDTTIPFMLNWFLRRGVPLDTLEVKLFGGADSMGSTLAVGNRNVEKSLYILDQYNLRPIACQVGGRHGRKLVFFTGTGEAFVRRLGAARKAAGFR